jgi:hypothetical protein
VYCASGFPLTSRLTRRNAGFEALEDMARLIGFWKADYANPRVSGNRFAPTSRIRIQTPTKVLLKVCPELLSLA